MSTNSAQRPAPGAGAWPTVWRYGLAILCWCGAAVAYLVASSVGVVVPWWRVAIDLTTGAVLIWGMRFRHRWPRGLVVVGIVVGTVSVSGAAAALWAFAHLATRRRWSEILLFGGLHVVVGVATSQVDLTGLDDQPPSWGETLVALGGAVIVVAFLAAVGSFVGARRDLIRALQERADEAERNQELRVLQGQAEERNRIAREMHDVLAHRISLVSLHAGVLAYRDDLPAEQVREIAGVIQDNARQSMSELRTILGSLRQGDDGAAGQPDAPQPGLDQVPTIFADARLAGQRLEVRHEIAHPELLPGLVGRHCYRVVQELVTNARKHAPNALVEIELIGAPGDGLRISSRNPLQRGEAALPGAGVGLIGVRERAGVLGGTMDSGLDDEGRFEVEVWFPW